MWAASAVPGTNPHARNRARRKDPFRRAQRAPVKVVAPVPCPLGKCEHLAGMHRSVLAGWIGPDNPVEGARCTSPGCECEGAL